MCKIEGLCVYVSVCQFVLLSVVLGDAWVDVWMDGVEWERGGWCCVSSTREHSSGDEIGDVKLHVCVCECVCVFVCVCESV